MSTYQHEKSTKNIPSTGDRSVGLAHVHLVWIPKRRKKVLVGQVKIRLAAILSEVATEKGWLIKGLEIAPDHVHVLVEHG